MPEVGFQDSACEGFRVYNLEFFAFAYPLYDLGLILNRIGGTLRIESSLSTKSTIDIDGSLAIILEVNTV